MRLVKLTATEATLAKLGYKIVGAKDPKAGKPMSTKARKAISKAMKARWAAKSLKKPS
jgi:hypothetical protein